MIDRTGVPTRTCLNHEALHKKDEMSSSEITIPTRTAVAVFAKTKDEMLSRLDDLYAERNPFQVLSVLLSLAYWDLILLVDKSRSLRQTLCWSMLFLGHSNIISPDLPNSESCVFPSHVPLVEGKKEAAAPPPEEKAHYWRPFISFSVTHATEVPSLLMFRM